MERLYDEIGKKIKLAAYVTFIVEAVIAVLEGIAVPIILVNTVDDSFFMFLLGLPLGLLVIGIGILVAWVSSWLLYGFGELIDKVCDIEQNTRGGQSKTRIKETSERAEKEEAGRAEKAKKEQAEKTKRAEEEQAKKEAAEKEALIKMMQDIEYIDIICCNCGESLSFQKGTKEFICPFCGREVKIDTY